MDGRFLRAKSAQVNLPREVVKTVPFGRGSEILDSIPSITPVCSFDRRPFLEGWNSTTSPPPRDAICIHVRHGDKASEMP